MKILLVNPNTLFPGRVPSLPLGLLQIGALPHINGHEVEILDCNIASLREIKKKIKKSDPDIIGFTSLTGKSLNSNIYLSKFAKENSDAIIAWGGVHASLLPYQTVSKDYVDIVTVGEGDFSFFNLINNLKDLKQVNGIVYKKNNKIIINPQERSIHNLDVLPLIPWELVSIKKYTSKGRDIRTISFPTSRGCPFNCAFCYNRAFYNRCWKTYSIKKIKENLENLISFYDVEGIKVDSEDNFIGNDTSRAIELSKLFKEYELKWFCQVRIGELSRHLIKEFKNNGCEYFIVGVESGSQRILNFLKKGIAVERIKSTFDVINRIGIKAIASFMLDVPTETEDDLNQSLELAKRLNVITIASFYQPYPGTDLYYYLIKNRMFNSPKSIEEWCKADFSTHHNFSKISIWKIKFAYYYLNHYHNLKILIKNKDCETTSILVKSIINSVTTR